MKKNENRSKGARVIARHLEKRNIEFETEQSFPDCRHKGMLRFDFFFVYAGQTFLIEYQGKQHYRSDTLFGNEYELLEQQKRDQVKREYCKVKGYHLLEIEYKQSLDSIPSSVDDFIVDRFMLANS